jgi:hypothetical protein
MRKINYLVLDATDHILRIFPTYKQAMTFKIAMGRLDWRIIDN